MNKTRMYFPILLLSCTIMMCQLACTSNSTGPSGVHTQTKHDNIITGVLYKQDGTTPAAGVNVLLRPRAKNTDILAGAISAGDSDASTATTLSDGTFRLEAPLQYERLSISAHQADSLYVLLDSIVNDSAVHVDGILKKPGNIQAVFPLQKPDGVILINGKFNFAGEVGHYDESGRVFTFNELAEGSYDLTFIASWEPYIIIQKSGVRVFSGQTALLDTMMFPSVGIPRILNFESLSACDKKNRIVSLQWSPLDTALVSGYHVYRQDAASGAMVRLNETPLSVPSYIDSAFTNSKLHPVPAPQEMYRNAAGQPASVVLYHVRAVSKDGFAGQPAMFFAFFN